MEPLFLGWFGGQEVLLLFFAVLLLFGGKKIPELMRGIGKGIREFNTARGTLEKELKEGMNEDEEKSSSTSRSRERQDIFAESERRSSTND